MGTILEQLKLTISLRGSREERDNCQIFRLTGQLDAFSEPMFQQEVVGKYIQGSEKSLILDLSGIDFIDSSGIGLLVRLWKQLGGDGKAAGNFQIVTSPRVTQALKVVKLDERLPLRPSMDEALANLPG